MKTSRFLLAAAFAAIVFTFFACSSDDGPGPDNSGENPSSSSGISEEQKVFCKLTAGACSQMSLSSCMELVTSGMAQIVATCTEQTPSSSSIEQEILGNISIYNITSLSQDIIRKVTIYSGMWCTVKCEEWDGISQAGSPFRTISTPINVGAQNNFSLPIGAYTIVVEDNSGYSFASVISSLPNGQTNIAWNGFQLDVEMDGGNEAGVQTGSITLYNIPTTSNISIRKVSVYKGTWKIIVSDYPWTLGLDSKAASYKVKDYSTPITANGSAKIGDFIPGAYTMEIETNTGAKFYTELAIFSGGIMNVTFTGDQLEAVGGE